MKTLAPYRGLRVFPGVSPPLAGGSPSGRDGEGLDGMVVSRCGRRSTTAWVYPRDCVPCHPFVLVKRGLRSIVLLFAYALFWSLKRRFFGGSGAEGIVG